jgi:hypothetical protein
LEHASHGLEKIVAEALRQSPADAPLLAWPLACGSRVAERTKALSFDQGILTVEAPDAAWRAELQELAPRYVRNIQRYTGQRVRGITFVLPK